MGRADLARVCRVPDIEIHRAPTRFVDGEYLGPQPGHAFKRSAGVLGDRDHARSVEVAVVLEDDAHAYQCVPPASAAVQEVANTVTDCFALSVDVVGVEPLGLLA